MKTLVFDVMLDGRFVHTFRYQYCPLFPIDEEELEKFVTDRLPTLNRICFDSFVEGFKKGAKAAEKEINKKFKSEI